MMSTALRTHAQTIATVGGRSTPRYETPKKTLADRASPEQAHPLRQAAEVGRDRAQAAKAEQRVRVQDQHAAPPRQLVQLRREPAPRATRLGAWVRHGQHRGGLHDANINCLTNSTCAATSAQQA